MSNQIETYIEIKLENRDQVSGLFRYILIVPVLIFAAAFAPGGAESLSIGMGVVVLPTLLAIVFRGVYPSYALRFNQSIVELSTRITAYALLLNDNYPSIEANSSVRVVFPDVEGGKKLNRLLPLVKWLLAIPLYRRNRLHDLRIDHVDSRLVRRDLHQSDATSCRRGALWRHAILEPRSWLRIPARHRRISIIQLARLIPV